MLIVNAHVLDVHTGTEMPPGTTVLLDGGRIVRVGGVDDPSQHRPLDLGGRWLIPALFNTHGHLQILAPGLSMGARDLMAVHLARRQQMESWLAGCLHHGIGTIQDSACYDLRINANTRRRIGGGSMPGPRIQQAVLVAPEKGAFSPRRNLKNRIAHALAGIPDADYDSPESGIVVYPAGAAEQVVRDAVDRAIDERGAEVIKLYDQKERSVSYTPGATVMTQEQMDATVDQARRRGVPSAMHHVTLESLRRGMRAGVDSLVHLVMDAPLEQRDVEALMQSGCMLQPTLTLAYFYSWDLPDMACHRHRRMERLARLHKKNDEPMVRDHWVERLRGTAARSLQRAAAGQMSMAGQDMSHIFRYWSPYAAQGMDNVGTLIRHGAIHLMACGTDYGASWCGPSLIDLELQLFPLCVEESDGTQPTAADLVRIATIQSARSLGLEEQMGSIEEGKRADLAVLDVSPLEDPTILGRPVAALIQDGKLAVDRRGLSSAGRHRLADAGGEY